MDVLRKKFCREGQRSGLGRVAMVLGVSKQAAAERYGPVPIEFEQPAERPKPRGRGLGTPHWARQVARARRR